MSNPRYTGLPSGCVLAKGNLPACAESRSGSKISGAVPWKAKSRVSITVTFFAVECCKNQRAVVHGAAVPQPQQDDQRRVEIGDFEQAVEIFARMDGSGVVRLGMDQGSRHTAAARAATGRSCPAPDQRRHGRCATRAKQECRPQPECHTSRIYPSSLSTAIVVSWQMLTCSMEHRALDRRMTYDLVAKAGKRMHDPLSPTTDAAEPVSLQRNDSVPLFTQLKQMLLVAIRDGQFAAGAPMPTETQLCEMFDVSRITVRRAVSELQNEGILEKRHGKGTFVTVQRIETGLMTLNGFSEAYSARGVDHHSSLLDKHEGVADARLSAALHIAEGAPVLHVQRLISTQIGPLTLDVSTFSTELFPGLSEMLADDVSIYGILRNRFGKQIEHVHRTINVKLAGRDETRVLGCNPGEPLFDMEKIVYDGERRALQWSRLLTPCNRITLTIDV